jgi:hypothetical protein
MKTIPYNDEAALWSRSRGTRLLPSSDDSNNIFSGTSLGTLGLKQPDHICD